MVLVRIGARGAFWLAWSIWVLCLALLTSGFVLSFFSYPPLEGEPAYLFVLYNALMLAFPTVGAFVAAHRPENPIGWLFCLVSVALSGQIFADTYSSYALFNHAGDLLGTETMAWVSQWIVFPIMMPVIALLFLLFPDGRLLSSWWRPVAWTAVTGGVLLALGDALKPGPLYIQTSVENPFGVGGIIGGVPAHRIWDMCSAVGGWLGLGSCAVAVGSLALRMYRANGEKRRQIAFFAAAAVVSPAGFLVAFWTQYGPINDITWTAGILGFLALPVTAAVAILRYRLYDIDVIVNRTLVYGALTACVVGIYVAAVSLLGMLFQTGVGAEPALIPLLVTGLVAVLFQPLRVRLQRAVNRLTYGERDEPYSVLSRLGRRLDSTLDPNTALCTIVETVAVALKLPYAAISLKRGGSFATAAESGKLADDLTILPLVHQSEEVGRLLVAPRSPGEEFTASDRRLLEDLAHQAGAAVHAARLTADLQRSRERLVTAREEERRRLRRDLHDGLGPTLGSVNLGLDVSLRLLKSRPGEAEALLTQLKVETKEAVTDIRRLVYGLRPPTLDDLGLVAAIREQAAKSGRLCDVLPGGDGESPERGSGLTFFVEAPDELPSLPAAVEVACYRIVQEAMNNVARHARASRCRIRLAVDDASNELVLEVVDDGIGLPENKHAGVGLHSMVERAEELGGTCGVTPGPSGGTRVFARLPLFDRKGE